MFITDQMCEKAIHQLRDKADEYGMLKGRVAATDHERKIVRAQLILEAPDGSVSYKESWAEAHEDYINAVKDHADAVTDFATIQTKMKAAEIWTEVWRSLNARGNRGHL